MCALIVKLNYFSSLHLITKLVKIRIVSSKHTFSLQSNFKADEDAHFMTLKMSL